LDYNSKIEGVKDLFVHEKVERG